MAEYIEREAAVSELMPIYKSASFRNRNVFSTARKCLEAVENIPAADVVEVVRCQECKFAEYMPGPMDYLCRRNGVCFRGRDFCSYGERKMDGGADDDDN